MAEIIIMPKLGFNMDEGQLVKWHKAVNDPVQKGELLFEINTDKTTMPVEAASSGTLLAILLEEGAFAGVFTPIAVIGEPGEDFTAALDAAKGGGAAVGKTGQEAATPSASAPAPSAATVTLTAPMEALKLTPRAQKLIQDEHIDPASLRGIPGTGYQGGITARDIKASPLARKIAAAAGTDLAALAGSGIHGKVMKADVFAAPQTGVPAGGIQSGEKQILSVTPYKGIRKIIGDKLAQSKFTAPHLYFTDSVDTSGLTAFRKSLNEQSEVKIAVSDLLTLAAAKALKKYPALNVSLVNGEIVTYKSINVGTAVAGSNGLVVPVIKNVQEKSLSDVARESKDLIARAKEGRLQPQEYADGTFTISNLGMFGIENFTAIINAPESAILSVSSARKKAVVITGEDGEDRIAIRPVMNIQLSADHRLIDGLLAVQFVGFLRQMLENPLLILV
ncbi:MAG: 2-oxo acid dehydrogenase subunit E2 [Treponema sp.]|jgi:pyruvate dehydrogenase E2 component (dihydrolipoamide acetyltransferase)|nr:2-oxo acid dehydrogenase subunit E2 [Treponema sp.]